GDDDDEEDDDDDDDGTSGVATTTTYGIYKPFDVNSWVQEQTTTTTTTTSDTNNKYHKKDTTVAENTLQIMRQKLESKLGSLKGQLHSLINDRYNDFLGLSASVEGIGDEKSTQHQVRQPLESIRNQIIEVKTQYDQELRRFEAKIQQRTNIRDKKQTIQLFLNISKSLSNVEGILRESQNKREAGEVLEQVKLLERVAADYNRLGYLMNKGGQYSFVKKLVARTEMFETTLNMDLVAYLKQWAKRYMEFIDNCNSSGGDGSVVDELKLVSLYFVPLEQCLRAFAALGQVERAELILRNSIAEPTITKILTRPLNRGTNSSGRGGILIDPMVLQQIHTEITDFVIKYGQPLIKYTESTLSTEGYSIGPRVFWKIISAKIIRDYSNLFIPGIPDRFQKNYIQTIKFVDNLETRLCNSEVAWVQLRDEPSFAEFMNKWQLSARDGGGGGGGSRSRAVSSSARSFEVKTPGDGFCTAEATIIYRAMQWCWSEDVFIEVLANRFWRLYLQLILRYNKYLNDNPVSGPNGDDDNAGDGKSAAVRSPPLKPANPNSGTRPSGSPTLQPRRSIEATTTTTTSGASGSSPPGNGGAVSQIKTFSLDVIEPLVVRLHDVLHLMNLCRDHLATRVKDSLASINIEDTTTTTTTGMTTFVSADGGSDNNINNTTSNGDGQQLLPQQHLYQMLSNSLESTLAETLQTNQVNRLVSLLGIKIAGYCEELAKSIRHTPSLYRHTNRPTPKKHLAYVAKILDPLKIFTKSIKTSSADNNASGYELSSSSLPLDIVSLVQFRVCKNLAAQFYGQVQDLLQSVAKTEASLQRFRKSGTRRFATGSGGSQQNDDGSSNSNNNNNNNSGGQNSTIDLRGKSELTTDDNKIRRQVWYDVCELVRDIETQLQQQSSSSLEFLKPLNQLVSRFGV
ncbi:hypothetical protein H4219_004718, partial [Mycoemilia scoparia]